MANKSQVKVVLVGDGAVGKTCLIVSYALDRFPNEYNPTVFDNYTVTVPVGQDLVDLGLFDTAGQEDYDKWRSIVYPETDVFIICFSVMSPCSFENVEAKWVPELRQTCPRANILLVGTQSDLRNNQQKVDDLQKAKQRPVREDQAESLVEKLRLRAYKECSAYTQDGLSDVFHEAICIALEPPPKNSNESWISKCLPCGGGRNT